MYHAIIKRKLRAIFEGLDQGDFESTVAGMARRFEHRFAGDHPLGGTRHTPAALRAWFQRLMRLTDHLDFEIHHIAVSGWPWDTTAVAEWTDRATLADGGSYENHGVHVVRLRWFKAVSIHAYLDTAVWAAACERMAGAGIGEAAAAPIED